MFSVYSLLSYDISELVVHTFTMVARALLSSSRLMVVSRRGKAVANWTRPSIEEMGVPTEPWKQVSVLEPS